MAQLTTYLRFNGTCREAMTFYKECLGGELTIQAVEGSPLEGQMPPTAKKNIVHSTLTGDGFALQGSDMLPPEGRVKGNGIALALTCKSDEEIKTLFAKLAEGGEITYALRVEFWGGTFGTLVDKFGIEWLFNYDKSQA